MKKLIPWMVHLSAFLLLVILMILLHQLGISIPYRCFMGGCLLLLAVIQTYEIQEKITSDHN